MSLSLILHVPLHVTYIQSLSKSKDDLAYHLTSHLRLNAIYWGLTALSILNHKDALDREDTIDFVLSCWDDEAGAFAAHPGHDAHVLSTTSAVQVLVIHGAIERVDVERVVQFILSLQQPSGVFAGDSFGETDTRFSYCAVNALSLLGKLNVLDEVYPTNRTEISRYPSTRAQISSQDTTLTQITRKDLLTAHILRCNNFDGGFGSNEGAESHAAQVFVCLAALAILGRLGEIGFGVTPTPPPLTLSDSSASSDPQDFNRSTPPSNSKDSKDSKDSTLPDSESLTSKAPQPSTYQTLAWWLAERQLPNGGLNGRPEKLEDVCYSFWVLSSLSILRKTHYINTPALVQFILRAQDAEKGGVADRPGDVADVFHTCFGVAGLSLLGYPDLVEIDPVYCMPREIIDGMGLGGWRR